MPRFGKPDATGRSSGKLSSRAKKLRAPPKDEPWCWLTRELLASPAWRALSVNARRLMDFLLVEDMNHAGTENGNLCATYDQLTVWGISRRKILDAIQETERLGFTAVQHGGRWQGTNQPSKFRLTFYADKEGAPPTNNWKTVTEENIDKWRNRQRPRKRLTVIEGSGG